MLSFFNSVNKILDNCCLTLFHAVSLATEKVEDLGLQPETIGSTLNEPLSNLNIEPSEQIWVKFSEAMVKLFPRKILETLQVTRLKLADRRT